MKEYIAKYLASRAHEHGSGEKAFLHFVSILDLSDWEALLSDVARYEPSAYEVIRPSSRELLIATTRALLSRLSPATKTLAGRALSRLLVQAARRERGDDQAVPVNLMPLAISLGCCVDTLRDLVSDTSLERTLRVEAARAVANIEEEEVEFWLSLDYDELPEIVPLMVAVLGRLMPHKALSMLVSLPLQPCPEGELEYPVAEAATALLATSGGKFLLLDILGRLPEWGENVFSAALAHDEITGILARQAEESRTLAAILAVSEAGDLTVDPSGPVPLRRPLEHHEISAGVEALLERWSPLQRPPAVPLVVIVHLFERFPSRTAFGALASLGFFYAARVKRAIGDMEESEWLLALVEALTQHRHIVLLDSASDAAGEPGALQWAYHDLLLRCLDIESTGQHAFRALVNARGERRANEVADYLARVLSSRSLTVSEVHHILVERYTPGFIASIFAALGNLIREERTLAELQSVGVQIYDHSPQLFEYFEQSLTASERFDIGRRSDHLRELYDEDPGHLTALPGVYSSSESATYEA